ncbi:MAG TPA: helix-turn-helix transcriptional regulator [Syntrophomonadaceae bacterium]|nr:helix-turn-helix transcriptional regulator [Syntrophomonadaceae bacterium]HPR94172.1 helix-turn-helix transcriptional regulator [Syntrophomonadaceae bacterium]
MLLGKQLQKWRQEKGISLEELARQLNTALAKVIDIESGKEMSADELLQIAKILDDEPENKTINKYYKRNGETLTSAVGARLRFYREERGLSISELGRQAGLSAAHLSEIERSLATPSLKTLEKISQVLDIPTGSLLPADLDETLGQKVRRLREAMGITQKELGEMLGVSCNMITQIETDRTQPSLKVLNNLADLFGISSVYFVMDIENEYYREQYNANALKTALKRPEIRQVVDLIAAWTNKELEGLTGIIERLNTYRSPLDAQYHEVKEFLDRSTNEERQLLLDMIEIMKQPGEETKQS